MIVNPEIHIHFTEQVFERINTYLLMFKDVMKKLQLYFIDFIRQIEWQQRPIPTSHGQYRMLLATARGAARRWQHQVGGVSSVRPSLLRFIFARDYLIFLFRDNSKDIHIRCKELSHCTLLLIQIFTIGIRLNSFPTVIPTV